MSAIAVGTFLLAPRGRQRGHVAWLLAGVIVPGLVNLVFTGTAQSTTSVVKWLPSSPYMQGATLVSAVLSNVRLLFGTLLDGQAWSAVFIPSGGGVIAWCALPALLALCVVRRESYRGSIVLLLALGMLIPTTYDSFLWNRLRYLWPFAPAWLLALAALAQLIAMGVARLHARLVHLGLLLTGLVAGSFAGQLSWSLRDLAESSDAIRMQQVELGRWAHDNLPPGARIGVNDTGAIAYLSDRPVFDVVGLTTAGEAKYWVGGAGSRFEHYARLDASRLPTHFIVYPAWMAMPEVLGTLLTYRTVEGATILGGTTKVAYVADYTLLHSSDRTQQAGGSEVDSLDVADLESERSHGYELFDARQQYNRVFSDAAGQRAEGGRSQRANEQFDLEVRPGGRFVARVFSDAPAEIDVRIGTLHAGRLKLAGDERWQEIALPVPAGVSGKQRVELSAHGARFTSLHYWSLSAAP